MLFLLGADIIEPNPLNWHDISIALADNITPYFIPS